jgi:hypothetical protein
LAIERLSLLPDGRLLYRLKRRWRDGTTRVIFEPLELVEKLAALVPPPRFNLVRYHGVLAPAARCRPSVVPSDSEAAEPVSHHGCRARQRDSPSKAGSSTKPRGCHPRNYSWAELLRRVFALDVLECDRCGGRMRILAAIHPPDAIRKILDCLGLPSRPPPIAPAAPDCDTDEEASF